MIKFLNNDSRYFQDFSKIEPFSKWNKKYNSCPSNLEEEIDLVATLADQSGFCAIQCKLYEADYRIKKEDIESFFKATSKNFTQRLFFDITSSSLEHEQFQNETIPTKIITIAILKNSNIHWNDFVEKEKIYFTPKKILKEHQKEALEEVKKGFSIHDRGKLIMACGTGKTFLSLKITEELFGKNSLIVYLVPSLSLMSQTIQEWKLHSLIPIASFYICSDRYISKDKENRKWKYATKKEDTKELVKKINHISNKDKMIVIFSTYQSLHILSEAQKEYALRELDLMICDEAHRTTGVKLFDRDESNFKKVHDQTYIQSKKRLYMTATPKIYKKKINQKSKEKDIILTSMDDAVLFGPIFYTLTFNDAVKRALLTDYKVIVILLDEKEVDQNLQSLIKEKKIPPLSLKEITKIIACYRFLSKIQLEKENRIRRSILFCSNIKKSKRIQKNWTKLVKIYKNQISPNYHPIQCQIEHIDGTDDIKKRKQKLNWLEKPSKKECRILSNVKCLSEGVDIPNLDSVIFFHTRKSIVDIIQAVGRVMRKIVGKKLGYILIPIAIRKEEKDLLKNQKRYQVISEILNALRSHDERIDSIMNSYSFGEYISDKFEIVFDDLSNENPIEEQEKKNQILEFTRRKKEENESIEKSIMTTIIEKCGSKLYWQEWASNISSISETYILRLKTILEKKNTKYRKLFDSFLNQMKKSIDHDITEKVLIEMLSQHMISKPVFDSLFFQYPFIKKNPISKSMEKILKKLNKTTIEQESTKLIPFYQTIQLKISHIQTIKGKQALIMQLYNNFFHKGFPRSTKSFGIVYTPIEVVDFIIHSINDILKLEFGKSLSDKGIHIMDPFVGTGSFITRLMQIAIEPNKLPYKYKNEIYANEMMLLPYYISSINIEQVYHSLLYPPHDEKKIYQPFNGICLADTFQIYEDIEIEKKDIDFLEENNRRKEKQRNLKFQVILCNPPYSRKQRHENDNNKSINYKNLDKRIKDTYVKNSSNALKDSYIRAIRLISDRLDDYGILGVISNNGYLEKPALDGIRKSLKDEFTSLYILNLRGDIRKDILSDSTEEGENIFGANSMNGNAITFFIKNGREKSGKIYYHDIGKHKSKEDKLNYLSEKKSIKNFEFETIIPNKYYDWINQREDHFFSSMLLGSKRSNKNKNEQYIFKMYSMGLLTTRDEWCSNSSLLKLRMNMKKMIRFYNEEMQRYHKTGEKKIVKDFVNLDKSKIKWSIDLYKYLKRNQIAKYEEKKTRLIFYRPFTKQWLYYDKMFNWCQSKWNFIFPNEMKKNIVIGVTGPGSQSGFSVLVLDRISELLLLQGIRCFPLKIYKKKETKNGIEYEEEDGITDEALDYFFYPGETICKDDVFYYIYGILHSKEYLHQFKNNLDKELPRIPRVKNASDFWIFSQAGRDLAFLHLNYDKVPPYPIQYEIKHEERDPLTEKDFYVKKMKFKKIGKNKDKSIIIYNEKITIINIPLEAYEYKVNGKSAIEWILARQQVRKSKETEIINDANDYALEMMNNSKYPLELLQCIITVSLETIKIINDLPSITME